LAERASRERWLWAAEFPPAHAALLDALGEAPAECGQSVLDVLGHLVHSISSLPRGGAIEVLLHTDPVDAQRKLFEPIGILDPVDCGERRQRLATGVSRSPSARPFSTRIR